MKNVNALSYNLFKVLVESEQMRKEADDIGPSAELDHWKKRMSKFNALLDEIKTPRVCFQQIYLVFHNLFCQY